MIIIFIIATTFMPKFYEKDQKEDQENINKCEDHLVLDNRG